MNEVIIRKEEGFLRGWFTTLGNRAARYSTKAIKITLYSSQIEHGFTVKTIHDKFYIISN